MSNQPPSLPPPGWYQDPEGQPGLRWWDGSTWTQDRTAAAVQMTPGNNLRDVGDWLNTTFRIVKERAGHLFTLVVALSLPVGLIVSFAMWQVFKELRFTSDNATDFQFTGPSAGLWVLAGVVLIVSFVLSMALYAAMQRQAMAALLERPEPWSKSLSEGLARAPKLLGNYLLLVLAFVVAAVVVGLLAVVNGGLAVLGFLGFLALAILAIGRLFLFIPAASCSPRGTPVIKTTLGLSKGYTGALIGRALLIFLIFIGIGIAGSLITAPLSQGIATPIDPDATTFDFADFIGDNYPQFALAQVITTLINGIGIAITAAATSIVYKDRGGAIDPALGLEPTEPEFGQITAQ
jgi:hypothetical protein